MLPCRVLGEEVTSERVEGDDGTRIDEGELEETALDRELSLSACTVGDDGTVPPRVTLEGTLLDGTLVLRFDPEELARRIAVALLFTFALGLIPPPPTADAEAGDGGVRVTLAGDGGLSLDGEEGRNEAGLNLVGELGRDLDGELGRE